MTGPLSGVRVLDLSSYIAGPYACTLLADLGADVVKIESPDGDTLRKYPSTLAAESRAFLGVNRGKRGLALDLKKPEGLAVLKRLVAKADVLVHNFRPSVPPRLGIDYASLRSVNPRLVHCALSGYGETGPLREKAGYDQVLQALTGMCAMQGPSADRAADPLRLHRRLFRGHDAGVRRVLGALRAKPHGRGTAGRRVAPANQPRPAVGALRVGRGRAARRGARHALGGRHRHPSHEGRQPLPLGQHAAFLEGPVRARGTCGPCRGSALRHREEARAARAGDRPEAARGPRGPHGARVGGALRRAGALRGRAHRRGHVRPPGSPASSRSSSSRASGKSSRGSSCRSSPGP